MAPEASEKDNIEQVPLKLGNQFQAIRHLARTQSNPLKSIAELVENAIDAKARHCSIERDLSGEGHFRVSDDGKGIMTADGRPDFKTVLQKIGDSIKTKLTAEEREGVKGEFGLGLLGFYALGERLIMVSKSRLPNGSTTKTYKMMIVKDLENAKVWTAPEPVERERAGVEVTVEALTPLVRRFSGQRVRDYLSTELRGRLTESSLELTFQDGDSPPVAVKPRVYRGTNFSRSRIDTRYGPLTLDLYLCPPEGEQDIKVSIGVKGTKVYDRIDAIPEFGAHPWISGKVQGFIDYPAARPTPNRTELERDKFYDELVSQLQKITPIVKKEIRDLEEDMADKQDRVMIEEIRRVFQKAFDDLPRGHYELFEIRGTRGARGSAKPGHAIEKPGEERKEKEKTVSMLVLDSLEIQPASTETLRGEKKAFRAVPLDVNRREVTSDLTFSWETRGAIGVIEDYGSKGLFTSGSRLGEGRVIARVAQGEIERRAEATVEVVEQKKRRERKPKRQPGIPNLEPVSDHLADWHSRYVANRNVIEYNRAHSDYLQVKSNYHSKRLYVSTLVSKEIVSFNVGQGFTPEQALEQMVEVLSSVHRAISRGATGSR